VPDELKEIPQSGLQRLTGRLGRGMQKVGRTVEEATEPLYQTHPIRSVLSDLLIASPLQSAGAALQDWSGTPREITEDYPYRARPFDPKQPAMVDPRILDVMQFGSAPAKGAKKAAKMAGKEAARRIDEAMLTGEGALGKALAPARPAFVKETGGRGRYETKQEGPFYRVNPRIAQEAGSTNLGIREQVRPSNIAAGSGRGNVPQPISDEEIGLLIRDPSNFVSQTANAYTQGVSGKRYGLPEMPESSLAKQSAIGRVFQLAASDNNAYKQAVFEAYGRKYPKLVQSTGAQNYDQLMEAAYRQLAKETADQFHKLPVRMSYHKQGEGNYQNSGELLRDIYGNRHMYVYQGGDPHDFLNVIDPETGLNTNEMFRAVHDFYGHAVHGNPFGPKGEEIAYGAHSQMFSPLARMAMAGETRGQNSFVNYTPINAQLKQRINRLNEAKYEAARRGDNAEVHEIENDLKDAWQGFQFAPQKSVLLPPEFLETSYTGGMPSWVSPLIVPEPGTTSSEMLTHFSHRPDLTFLDPKKYGTGIKGAEMSRLRSAENPVMERAYAYTGDPALVKPEKGLGSHRYGTMGSGLYNLSTDPLAFNPLAIEANRVPWTSQVNRGIVRAPQAESDVERMIKEYGYSGMVNPDLGMAILYNPTPVSPFAKGGTVSRDAMQMAAWDKQVQHKQVGGVSKGLGLAKKGVDLLTAAKSGQKSGSLSPLAMRAAADKAEELLQKSSAFKGLKGQDRQRAIESVRAKAERKGIPRTKADLTAATEGEEDIARSMLNSPAYKIANVVPKSAVEKALEARQAYRAEPPTTPGPNASEKEWAEWGAKHGVNMTVTTPESLGISDLTTGREIMIPGGLKGTFTIPDMFWMKANNINPAALPQDVHTELMKKFIRTHKIESPDEVDVFNRLNFALLSPNAPLTANEFLAQRARLRTPEELSALAGRVGEEGLNQTAAAQLGVGQAGSGGMGVLGTADLSSQAMLAKLIKEKPSMFQMAPGETMRDVTLRVMNQVPGLGPKTASLGTPWLDLEKANTSAVDLHMIKDAYPRLLHDPIVGEAFRERMAGLLNTRPTVAAILSKPEKDVRDAAIAIVGGTDLSRLYRLKSGELNRIPDVATPDRLAYEPKSFSEFNPFYSRVVDYVDESRGANPDIELFPEQWRKWDVLRQRIEPHEFAHPDFRLLPRQSFSEMQDALTAHKEAGYTQSANPVMKLSDWRKLYYGRAVPEILAPTAAAGAAAAAGQALLSDAPEKARGGPVHKAEGGMSSDDLIIEERPL
jgi:hypothetical protein